jgi:hypothetical protein
MQVSLTLTLNLAITLTLAPPPNARQYFIGSFNGSHFVNARPSHEVHWVDVGRDNYAGVTFSGMPRARDGRTLFLGWLSNWACARRTLALTPTLALTLILTLTLILGAPQMRTKCPHPHPHPHPHPSPPSAPPSADANEVPTEGWRSAMTLPRSLHLVHAEPPPATVEALASETTSGSDAALASSLVLASRPVVELRALREGGARTLRPRRVAQFKSHATRTLVGLPARLRGSTRGRCLGGGLLLLLLLLLLPAAAAAAALPAAAAAAAAVMASCASAHVSRVIAPHGRGCVTQCDSSSFSA